MLRLNEVIEKSKQITNDNFSLFVDGILRIQECNKEEFNNYMIKYKANNIIDIAESIYFNKVYVYTDIKNMKVDQYISEVFKMKENNESIILKVCKVLDLSIIKNKIDFSVRDHEGKEIGYYEVRNDNFYFYNKEKLIAIVENGDTDATLIKISSVLTNLYDISNSSIS